MAKQKTSKQVAKEFKESMQKIADEGNMSISVEFQGKTHLIAEPKTVKQTKIETIMKTTKEFLKYNFSHDEVFKMGEDLARISAEVIRIKDEAKTVAQEFKAQIAAKQSEMAVLGSNINNGYEHRYVPCEVHLNEPIPGKKSIYRMDTGELVKTVMMDAEEMQTEIPFEINDQLDEKGSGNID